jgi:hypothetical protein
MEGSPFRYDYQGEDVLLLAGDIHTRNRLHLLLVDVPKHVKIFFVAGNHEWYHSIFEECNQYFKELENDYNFRFLNNESDVINGIPIYGGTMFSDWELDGIANAWFAKHQAKDMINDFHCIKKMGQHFEEADWTPTDHELQFAKFVDGLNIFLKHTEGAPQRIVMSHFMPLKECSHERFRSSTLNPYFAANMNAYMGWSGLWVSGHGHDPVDFMNGDTRVVMNPKGYVSRNGPENPHFNPDLIIEL